MTLTYVTLPFCHFVILLFCHFAIWPDKCLFIASRAVGEWANERTQRSWQIKSEEWLNKHSDRSWIELNCIRQSLCVEIIPLLTVEHSPTKSHADHPSHHAQCKIFTLFCSLKFRMPLYCLSSKLNCELLGGFKWKTRFSEITLFVTF